MYILMGTNDAHHTGAEYAYIQLDKRDIELIQKRRSIFVETEKKDGAISFMEYVDYSVIFLYEPPDGADEFLDPLYDHGYVKLGRPLKLSFKQMEKECSRMIINSSGFWWDAYQKHTDCDVSTKPISFREFARMVKDGTD